MTFHSEIEGYLKLHSETEGYLKFHSETERYVTFHSEIGVYNEDTEFMMFYFEKCYVMI